MASRRRNRSADERERRERQDGITRRDFLDGTAVTAAGLAKGEPQYAARQPFRNVSIANSDSEMFAYTHSAINEGYRAVQDLPSL